jgi:WD40 repeat protein
MTSTAEALEQYAHDAFISYSTVGSARLGAALEHALTVLGRVWDEPRAMHVFRDVSDQPATTGLAADLLRHLDGSRYLILLTSPAAARSPWVELEVRHWLDRVGSARLLLALGDGELVWDRASGTFTPRSTLPPVLKEVLREEPKWVDLRWTSAEDFDPNGERFLCDVADLSAAVTGVPKEQIVGRHWREHRKALARRLAEDAAGAEEAPADLSLLLSAAANALDNTPPTQRALSHVLEATADLQATVVPRDGGSEPRVTAVTQARDDDEILLGFSDGTVAVWDTRSGKERQRSRPAAARSVTALIPLPSGTGLAVGYDDGGVAVLPEGRAARQLQGDGSPVLCLAVSSTGEHVAVSAGDSSVRLFPDANGRRTVDGFTRVAKLRFEDETRLLVFDWGTLVRLDVETAAAERVGTLPFLPRPGPKAYNRDGTRCVYTQLDGGGLTTCGVPEDGSDAFFEGPPGFIDLVAMDPDGRYVAEVVPGELLIWRVEPHDPAPVRRSPTSVLRGADLVVGAGARWVAVLGDDRCEIQVPRTSSLCTRVAGHVHDVPSVVQAALDAVFAPDGRVLAWISYPTTASFAERPLVSLVDPDTGEVLGGVGDDSAGRLRFVGDRVLEVTNLEGRVTSWDVSTGRRLRRGPSPAPADDRAVHVRWESRTIAVEDGVRELDLLRYGPEAIPRAWCLQQGGPLWALASSDGSVTVRDAEAAAACWTVPGIRAAALALDRCGTLLAAVGGRGRLVLLDVPTGEVVARLGAHPGPLHRLAFSDDGTRLAVVSPGGPLTVVDTDAASWVVRARQRAGRSLTSAERAAFGLDGLRTDAPVARNGSTSPDEVAISMRSADPLRGGSRAPAGP